MGHQDRGNPDHPAGDPVCSSDSSFFFRSRTVSLREKVFWDISVFCRGPRVARRLDPLHWSHSFGYPHLREYGETFHDGHDAPGVLFPWVGITLFFALRSPSNPLLSTFEKDQTVHEGGHFHQRIRLMRSGILILTDSFRSHRGLLTDLFTPV